MHLGCFQPLVPPQRLGRVCILIFSLSPVYAVASVLFCFQQLSCCLALSPPATALSYFLTVCVWLKPLNPNKTGWFKPHLCPVPPPHWTLFSCRLDAPCFSSKALSKSPAPFAKSSKQFSFETFSVVSFPLTFCFSVSSFFRLQQLKRPKPSLCEGGFPSFGPCLYFLPLYVPMHKVALGPLSTKTVIRWAFFNLQLHTTGFRPDSCIWACHGNIQQLTPLCFFSIPPTQINSAFFIAYSFMVIYVLFDKH